MYQAVLFDLDGTLTDTLHDISASMERALAAHGLHGWPEAEYRYMVGDGAHVLAHRAVGDRAELEEDVYTAYMAEYDAHKYDTTKPYPGVPELLAALQKAGLRLAVLSNKPHRDTVGVVGRYFPEVRFAAVQGQVTGMPLKPDPTSPRLIAAKLGIQPRDFLYLGDTAVDMRCAANAGMCPVGVLWGFRTAEELKGAGAAHLLRRPAELLKLIDSQPDDD